MSRFLPMAAVFTGIAPIAVAAQESRPAAEQDHYRVEHLPLPAGVEMEVGGIDFTSGGRLVVSTRRGQVWLVDGALDDDPGAARFTLFAEGLMEGLGLAVVDDVIHVVQRTELSRLLDTDGDDRCDRIEVISDQWGCTGNYHEFAYGLPRDRDGNFYVSLNVGFFDPYWYVGQSNAEYRGWILQIRPDGTTTPWASGFRSPDGLGVNAEGDLFATDNQGDWSPVCPLYHVVKGGFYGHPASLRWSAHYRNDDRLPEWYEPPPEPRRPAAVWFPYELSRSTGNVVADRSGGAFGPFDGQLFAAELTNGLLARCQLERVRGEYQGAVFRFRGGVGSAHRLCFAPDGSLMVGLTNRGWGGEGPSHGIGRVRFTGVVPLEMRRVHLLQDGFDIEFTQPLGAVPAPAQIEASQYDYAYYWKYGSSELDTRALTPVSVALSEDRTVLTVRFDDLRAGYMTRLVLRGVRAVDGTPLLHEQVDYTLNQLPHGPATTKQIARAVPPPQTREQDAEGWVHLTDGGALDGFSAEGFALADHPTPAPEAGVLTLGNGDRVLGSARGGTLRSHFEWGSATLELDLMLPRKGAATLLLADRYPVPVDAGMGQGAGEWNRLRLEYAIDDAPTTGTSSGAVLRSLAVNGETVRRDVALAAIDGSPGAANGPLVFQAATGAAVRNVRVRAEPAADDDGGWRPLWGEQGIDAWPRTGAGQWRLRDGVLTGKGGTGHLLSPDSDYVDFELRARCRINPRGNSGIFFRAAPGEVWPIGYEAQINRSAANEPVRTGSLYHHAAVTAPLIPFDDTWFELHVRCSDTEAGTRIEVWVNGVRTVDWTDTERRHGAGHIAFQQHHDGSVVQFRDVRVRRR